MYLDEDKNPFYKEEELPAGLVWHLYPAEKPEQMKKVFIRLPKIKKKGKLLDKITKSSLGPIGWDAGGPWYFDGVTAWAEIPAGWDYKTQVYQRMDSMFAVMGKKSDFYRCVMEWVAEKNDWNSNQ